VGGAGRRYWPLGRRPARPAPPTAAAVDGERRAADVPGQGGGEKEDGAGDVGCLAGAANRDGGAGGRLVGLGEIGAALLDVDVPRQNRVDPDPVLPQLQRHRPRQHHQPGFRGAVVRPAPIGGVGGAGGNGDDLTATLGLRHPPGDRLAREEDALQIRVEDAVPFLLADLEKERVRVDPGAGNEGVGESMLMLERGDHASHGVGITHVGGVAGAVDALGREAGAGRLDARRRAVVESNIGASATEGLDDGVSETSRAAGDQHGLPLEPERGGHRVPPQRC